MVRRTPLEWLTYLERQYDIQKTSRAGSYRIWLQIPSPSLTSMNLDKSQPLQASVSSSAKKQKQKTKNETTLAQLIGGMVRCK